MLPWGPNRNGDRFSPFLGPQIAELMTGVPVGFIPGEGGELVHRAGGDSLIRRRADGSIDIDDVVGLIDAAWTTALGVHIAFHLLDERPDLRALLLSLERSGRLPHAGVSPVLRFEPGPPRETCANVGPKTGGRTFERIVQRVHEICSVDLVSRPGGIGARVRRSLPLDFVPKGDHVCMLKR